MSRALTLFLIALPLVAATLPRAYFDAEALAYARGDLATQRPLADAVVAHVTSEVDEEDFHTGSALIDDEWVVATHQMAILGLGQIVLAHPELRDAYLPAMRRAAEVLVSRRTLEFGRRQWGTHPLDELGSRRHGHAYLGYTALALGMLRAIDPDMPQARVHDRMIAGLAGRLDAAPTGVIETYPGATFPPDVAAVAGAIGMYDLATGADHAALLARFEARFAERWVDARGYLVQRTDRARRRAADGPRGSGTAVAAYFLSFSNPELSRRLAVGLRDAGGAHFLGFGAAREYPPGESGLGDVDSGPVLLGVSVTATGFAIAAARAHGHQAQFRALTRTALLFGVPVTLEDGTRPFVVGGPVGDAIMLAMLTALPVEELRLRARSLRSGV